MTRGTRGTATGATTYHTAVEIGRGGEATDEEVAAIVAAVEVAWPRPAAATPPEPPPRWRFSGRWWTKPVPLRRTRPWTQST
jgi:Acyl-CoA carboxylase epsilon subunit